MEKMYPNEKTHVDIPKSLSNTNSNYIPQNNLLEGYS
jgi:hypothetical protein